MWSRAHSSSKHAYWVTSDTSEPQSPFLRFSRSTVPLKMLFDSAHPLKMYTDKFIPLKPRFMFLIAKTQSFQNSKRIQWTKSISKDHTSLLSQISTKHSKNSVMSTKSFLRDWLSTRWKVRSDSRKIHCKPKQKVSITTWHSFSVSIPSIKDSMCSRDRWKVLKPIRANDTVLVKLSFHARALEGLIGFLKMFCTKTW